MVTTVLPRDGIGTACAIARLNAADAPRRPSAPETITSGSADGTPGPGCPPTTPQMVSTNLYLNYEVSHDRPQFRVEVGSRRPPQGDARAEAAQVPGRYGGAGRA